MRRGLQNSCGNAAHRGFCRASKFGTRRVVMGRVTRPRNLIQSPFHNNVRKKIVAGERNGRGRRRRRTRSLWTGGASPETFSVVSSENDFGDAPTGRPILAGPIPGDKMARYQKERHAEPEKWRLIAGRQSGPAIISVRENDDGNPSSSSMTHRRIEIASLRENSVTQFLFTSP